MTAYDQLLAQLPQEPRELHKLERAGDLAPAVLEIQSSRNAAFGLQEFRTAARRRRQERHSAFGSRGGDRVNERQVPDHVADATFGLDDNCRCHVD